MFEGRISFVHVCCSGCLRWYFADEISLVAMWERVRVVAISILKKGLWKIICLMLRQRWWESMNFACHVSADWITKELLFWLNWLFDSIACWTLHKLKRRFRFLIGQRHGGEKKYRFHTRQKNQIICADVSQWHVIICYHIDKVGPYQLQRGSKPLWIGL